jgi:predicted transcriptional regulator
MRPITAGDLMNPEVLTLSDDMTVREAAAFLLENEISGAPVADRDGNLVGVLSLKDVAAASSDGHPGADGGGERGADGERRDLRVSDVMRTRIASIAEDATVPELATLMLRLDIHRVLVTREDRAVGVVSTSDLLGLLVAQD